MPNIRKGLVPSGTRSLGGDAGCGPALLRRSSDYQDLNGKGDPFTPGDLISLAVLYARAHDPRNEESLPFYRDAYLAVCKGLDIPPVNELTQTLGIDPQPEREGPGSEDFFRLAGIGRFLWARAHMIGLQDPWGHVMEGDIWGLRRFDEVQPQYHSVKRGIAAYVEAVNQLPGALEHIDNALCALLFWDTKERSVTYEDLRTKHGMPKTPEWEF